MFWDDLIRRWRRDTRGGMSPRLLRSAAGHVAVVPGPRPRRRLRITWLLLIALAIAVILVLFESGQVQAISAAVSA